MVSGSGQFDMQNEILFVNNGCLIVYHSANPPCPERKRKIA